jgi:hypothetical protein
MREGFEQHLRNVRDDIEVSKKPGNKPAEGGIDKSKPEDEIRLIQAKKQQIMYDLNRQFGDLRRPDYHPERPKDARFIKFESGKYLDQSGNEVTPGELLTDRDWGIKYFLDPETVPKPMQKRFLFERAEKEIRDLLDQQIIIDQKSAHDIPWKEKLTYELIRQDKEAGREKMGLTAEKMVRNFLKKLTINFPNLDFEVDDTDVFQNVHQKLDIIIKVRRYSRGLKIEVPDEPEIKGIQFTTKTKEGDLRWKKKQVNRAKQGLGSGDEISDIVIVTLPIENFWPVYNQWKKTKASGGPDKLWPERTKEKIFRNVMKDLISPKEINRQWGMILGEPESEQMAA